jgi:hypothetical protein
MDNLCFNVILTLAAMAVGGFITWLVSKHYYVEAANDLSMKATIFGNFLQQWKEGKDVFLEFRGLGGALSGQGITVHPGVIQAKITLCDPPKVGDAK